MNFYHNGHKSCPLWLEKNRAVLFIPFIKGECVSCGRRPPWPHHAVCPYCGEQVRMPVWWTVGRVVVPVVCAVSIAGVLFLTRPDWVEARETVGYLSTAKAFLLAAVVVVLCAPCSDSDLIASSRAEILIPQVKALAGCLLVGVAALVVNAGMAFARTVGWGAYLLYAATTLCICVAPFFYRLPPWRVAVAVLLLVCVLFPLHAANFF